MSAPTVAIIGASANPEKYGNQSVRAHLQAGYTVFPVNPRGGIIEGLPVVASLAQISVPLDRISLYVPPSVGLTLLDEIAAKTCRELWLNPGSESDELIEKARARGLNVIVACSIIHAHRPPASPK